MPGTHGAFFLDGRLWVLQHVFQEFLPSPVLDLGSAVHDGPMRKWECVCTFGFDRLAPDELWGKQEQCHGSFLFRWRAERVEVDVKRLLQCVHSTIDCSTESNMLRGNRCVKAMSSSDCSLYSP